MPDSLAVVVNPAAGKGAGAAFGAEVVDRLDRRAIGRIDLVAEPSASAAVERVRSLVEAGLDRLIVVGGDGLVHSMLPVVADSGVALGLVGGGTGNDFARALGLPDGVADLDAALDAALGPCVPVDALQVGDRWVASVLTQGFSVTTNEIANRLRWPTDARRYVLATALALPKLRSEATRLTIDGVVHELDLSILAVGNTRFFGGGTPICPGANPTDGEFEVIAIGPLTRFELVRFYPTVDDGTFLTNPLVRRFSGRHLRVEGGATDVWGDGEAVSVAPVDVEVRVGALLVAGELWVMEALGL